MNVFVAEHPMIAGEPRRDPRLRRWLLRILIAYPLWLLVLGPFWALDERGLFDVVPWSARKVVYSPAIPIFQSQLLSPLYVGYMNWWYEDPDAPETTP
jgi:hypothetical protein